MVMIPYAFVAYYGGNIISTVNVNPSHSVEKYPEDSKIQLICIHSALLPPSLFFVLIVAYCYSTGSTFTV
jgi:hypothetical protein